MRQNKFSILVRTIAITLLVAIVYYFAGYKLVYAFVIHDAKQDAQFAMHNQSNFTSMSLSADEYSKINWTEKNKEFCLNKQLYDVVSIQQVANRYVLKVYNDRNETMWVEAMHDFVKWIFPSDQDKRANHAESLLSAFQKEYTPLETVKVVFIPEEKIITYSHKEVSGSSISTEPIWHPPASC